MQQHQSVRWHMPALLFFAVSSFTYAGTLPGVQVALRIFPAMGQAQAGRESPPAAQTPAEQTPPAKKHRFTLNVDGVQVGIGSKTQKPPAPATATPPKATPTTSNPTPQTTVAPAPQGSQGAGAGKVTFNPIATAGTQQSGSGPQAYQPPEPIMPADGQAEWDGDMKKPMLFKWTPVGPKPKGLARYRVAVWQLTQGQTGPQAIKANQPIITKDVDNLSMTQAVWPPDFVIASCKPPNLCSYVWSVQALDKKGRPVGVNGGIVSMEAFRYEPGAAATRGTALVAVDGAQPAAPGIFDRWGELYAEAGEDVKRDGSHPDSGILVGNGMVTNNGTAPGIQAHSTTPGSNGRQDDAIPTGSWTQTSTVPWLSTTGQQNPQPQKSELTGAHVTATNTATGVRLDASGQQQKPQPASSGYTVTSPGIADMNGTVASGQQQNPQPRNDERFTATVNDPVPNGYPIVAINITFPSNPDAFTVNWGDGDGTNKFSIEAVGPPKDARGMGRLYGGVTNSRILVVIKKNGNLVCGGQTSFGAVQGGFAPESKVWSGRDAASLLGKDCGSLPAGDYELDTQVVGTQGGTDVALSALATRTFTITVNGQQAYQPPQLIQPASRNVAGVTVVNNGAPGSPSNERAYQGPTTVLAGTLQAGSTNGLSVGAGPATAEQPQKPQPRNGPEFNNSTGADVQYTVQTTTQSGGNWVNVGSTPAKPQPAESWIMSWTENAMPTSKKEKQEGPVTYRVSVWEILPGQDSAQAIKANQPIIEKLTDEPQLAGAANAITGSCKPPYLCDYVWNVQALNREGKPIGGNNGTSEEAYFSYDSRAGTFVQRQPAGGRNETRQKPYILGVNMTFLQVAPGDAAAPVPNPNLRQNPGYLPATGNPAPAEAIKANTPIIEQSGKAGYIGVYSMNDGVTDQMARPSGTAAPQTPILEQSGETTRTSSAGTYVTGPDTCNGQTLAAGGTCTLVTANPNGGAAQTFTVTNTGGSPTSSLDTRPPKAQQPGQERDVINKGLPITNKQIDRTQPRIPGAASPVPHELVTPISGTPVPIQHDPEGMATPGTANGSNGKAVPHETVTPSQDTEVGIEHNPVGMAAHPTTNGGSAPQAKPAKKKSKIGIHVTF